MKQLFKEYTANWNRTIEKNKLTKQKTKKFHFKTKLRDKNISFHCNKQIYIEKKDRKNFFFF